MADRDEFGAFLVGFVVGSLTGAVAALLLAPQTGEETRTIIKDKAIELKDKAAVGIDDAYAQAEAAATEARARFEDLAEVTRSRAGELQQRGSVMLEQQKSKISDAIQQRKPENPESPESSETPAPSI
jgi:gas vesicle protein